MFINPECCRAHVVSGVCEKSTMCNECGSWFPNEFDLKHLYNGVACPYCGKSHNEKSDCFITTSKETVKKHGATSFMTWRHIKTSLFQEQKRDSIV